MTFTTLTFIGFLVLVFAAYWALAERRAQNLLLLVVSYVFYGWWDYRFCVLMLASSLVDYAGALAISRARSVAIRRAVLCASLTANLGLLGFFKYFNFFAESLQALATQLGWRLDPITLRIVLPVGISFYTFQSLSYAIDVYRGNLRATTHLVDYLAYVAFFPQLVAGPIERATNLLPQFLAPRIFDEANAAEGLRYMLWGFFKKIAIADRLAALVDSQYSSLDTARGPVLALATVAFAFQIYCDFSAYSDIAIGTARLFGFRLTRNFAYPYFSQSVSEFWRRWHITLSTWFRDYIYYPLGGSRRGSLRTCTNLFVTFAISGLWHGAAWNYVVWGALMGIALIGERVFRLDSGLTDRDVPCGPGAWPSLRALLRMTYTFAIIWLGWIFFRAPSLNAAWSSLRRMGGDLFDPAAYAALAETMSQRVGQRALVAMCVIVAIEWAQRRHAMPLVFPRLAIWQRWALYTAALWLTLFVGPKDVSSFIYFQF